MILPVVSVLTLGAFVQGFFGFGFSAVAVTLLTLTLSTPEAVGQVVSIAPVSTITATIIQHRSISYRGVLPLALGTLLFFPLGVWLLFAAPERGLHIALGAVVITAALMQLFPGKLRLFPPGLLGGGLAAGLSGLFGGAIGIPGLTMTAYIYGRESDPNVARASLQFFFLFTTVVATTTHAVAGTITLITLRNALFALLPVVGALYLGITLARKTHPEKLRYIYAVALGLLGVYTVVRTLL
jgi:hypothetical protein